LTTPIVQQSTSSLIANVSRTGAWPFPQAAYINHDLGHVATLEFSLWLSG